MRAYYWQMNLRPDIPRPSTYPRTAEEMQVRVPQLFKRLDALFPQLLKQATDNPGLRTRLNYYKTGEIPQVLTEAQAVFGGYQAFVADAVQGNDRRVFQLDTPLVGPKHDTLRATHLRLVAHATNYQRHSSQYDLTTYRVGGKKRAYGKPDTIRPAIPDFEKPLQFNEDQICTRFLLRQHTKHGTDEEPTYTIATVTENKGFGTTSGLSRFYGNVADPRFVSPYSIDRLPTLSRREESILTGIGIHALVHTQLSGSLNALEALVSPAPVEQAS